jgi:hypothetical protein
MLVAHFLDARNIPADPFYHIKVPDSLLRKYSATYGQGLRRVNDFANMRCYTVATVMRAVMLFDRLTRE